MLEFEFCHPDTFRLNADGLGGVGSNGGVVGNKWGFKAVKSVAVDGQVISRCVDEPGKVVLASWDIDGLEEV